MTIYQMFELCQVEVPQASQTMIMELINQRVREFAHRTECYLKTANLTIVANTIQYTLATEFTDIDNSMVRSIIFKNSDGEYVEEEDTLKYDITNGIIRFYSFQGESLTAIPSNISTITFTYVAIPTTKIISSTLTEIDSQFHEGVRSGVMERLYKLYPTLQKTFPDGSSSTVKDISMIQLSTSEFEKTVFRGIRYANTSPSMIKEIFNVGF